MPPSVQANGSNEHGSNTKVTPFRYTASAAFIDTLIAAGVKYLFVNLGTDHPGLVEVFAHASMTKRKDFPHVLTCPNEMVALTVAHRYLGSLVEGLTLVTLKSLVNVKLSYYMLRPELLQWQAPCTTPQKAEHLCSFGQAQALRRLRGKSLGVVLSSSNSNKSTSMA